MDKFIISVFADEIHEELEKQMNSLEQYGIKHIEIRGVNGKCIVDYSLEEVREIKRRLDLRGLKVSAIGSPIGKIYIAEDFKPHLELFKHTLEIAKIMEVNLIRMFSFFIPQGEEPKKYREEVINRWRQFIEAAKGHDVILLHENEKDIYGDTAERCLDLLESLNCDFVKAAFDPANFVQCNVETYPHAYELLKDYIIHMHIKDALYSDGSVVPSGQGDGQVTAILRRLKEAEYRGFLTIEPHLTWFKGFDELEGHSHSLNTAASGEKEFSVAIKALDNILKDLGGR